MADEAVYEKPTSQLDLEARLAEDYTPPSQIEWTNPNAKPPDPEKVKGRDFKVEGNETDAYTPDVDPMYQNYANESEKPFRAEGDDNPEAKVEKELLDKKEDEGGSGEGGESPSPQASAATATASARTTSTRKSSK